MVEAHALQIQELKDAINEIKEILHNERAMKEKPVEIDPVPTPPVPVEEEKPIKEETSNASPEPRRRNTFSSPLSPEILKMRRNTTSVSPLRTPSLETSEDEKKKIKKMKKKAEKEEKKAEKEEKKKKKLERKRSESAIRRREDPKDMKPKRKKSYFKLFRFSTTKRASTEEQGEKVFVPSHKSDDYSSRRLTSDTFQRENSYHRWNIWTKIIREEVKISKEEDIDLSNMELTQLPESFVLTKMKSALALNISCNLFEVWPPELVSSSLVELNIAINIIREIPPEISKLTNLKSLSLGGNKLGYIPSSLCELTSIEYLDVSNNSITVIPDEIANLTNLKELLIFGNKIESVPDSLSRLTGLEFIDISFNSLAEIPSSICSILLLKHLDLSYNLISNIPISVSKLQHLKYFSVRGNKLESLPFVLTSIPNLKRILRATDNPYTKSELLEASMKGDGEIVAYLESHKESLFIDPEDLNGGGSIGIDEKAILESPREQDMIEVENVFDDLGDTTEQSESKEVEDHLNALEEQFKSDLTGMMDLKLEDAMPKQDKEEVIFNDDISELEKLVEATFSKPRDFNDMGRRVSLKRLISAKTVDLYRSDEGTAAHLNEKERTRINMKMKEVSSWASEVIEKELIPEVLTIKTDITSQKKKPEYIDIILGLDLMKRIVQSAMPSTGKDDSDNLYNINTVDDLPVNELVTIISDSVNFIEDKYRKMIEILKGDAPSTKMMDIVYCVKELRANE